MLQHTVSSIGSRNLRAYVIRLARLVLLGFVSAACVSTVCGSGSEDGTSDAGIAREMIMMPMRDGVRLRTAIYRSPASTRAMPVVLTRTAYNSDSFEHTARQFATADYIAVVQDSRGRYGSEGEFPFYFGEGQDGFDCIDWSCKQPWCDGRVATTGASWMGSVQWLAASHKAKILSQRPPPVPPTFIVTNTMAEPIVSLWCERR